MPRILSLWGKIRAMEVRLYSNSSRPGVGLKPRRESQRPLLPQHARHCPVLEAGSALGLLVYPPLEPNESFHIEYEGEGRYQLTYFFNTEGAKWEPVFTVAIVLPIGSIGMIKEEVYFANKTPPISRDTALGVMRALVVPEDLGTPPGAISLRGATNFKTPTGWDTVYTPIAKRCGLRNAHPRNWRPSKRRGKNSFITKPRARS